MATSSLTWTFPTDGDKDTYWTDFCDAQGLTYTDAADAENVGIGSIKTQAAQAIADRRASVGADIARQTAYNAEYTSLLGY